MDSTATAGEKGSSTSGGVRTSGGSKWPIENIKEWPRLGKESTASIVIDLANETIKKGPNWKPVEPGQEKGEVLFTVYRMPDTCDDEDPSHLCWVNLILDNGMGKEYEIHYPPGCESWGH